MATMQYNIYHHAQGCRHSETEPSSLCDKPGRRNLSDRDGSGREAGGRGRGEAGVRGVDWEGGGRLNRLGLTCL